MDPMEAIRTTFFQECDELLADLEAGLLALEAGAGDPDTVNAVFRAVHSIKGGAGAFGLEALVRFAHVFETTLDGLRNGALAPEPQVLAVLLRAADHLADEVNAAKAGAEAEAGAGAAVVAELEALTGQTSQKADDAGAAGLAEPDFGFRPMTLSLDLEAPPPQPSSCAGEGLQVRFRPAARMYQSANDALFLIRELERLGPCTVSLDATGLPDLEDLDPAGAYLEWTVTLHSPLAGEAQVREAFEFVEGDCELVIEPVDGSSDETLGDLIIAAARPLDAGPVAAAVPAGMETAAPFPAGLPEDLLLALGGAAAAGGGPGLQPDPTLAAPVAPPPPSVRQPPATVAEPLVQTTIRVDLDRVDRLIDLVGELVINQAMLAQRVVEAGLARSSTIALGLDDLEQLTREIQDSVMAIRAQPVKSVFQRMPRLVREVAAMTGKRVRLVTEGEATEVDKTVIERLSDPITHMIRNAIDHGLETPEARLAAGKPEEGLVRLSAQHRSGRIIIEVSDDGRGIHRERVRKIAEERGLVEADAVLTDEEVDNLIFAPGFSTASSVSDISGRGVGMDVVKRSIQALGGRIVIASRPGEGSTFTLSLPLTLAVLDGMVVSVGDQTLVVPISVIVETLQPKASDIRLLGPTGAVLAVRGAHVPLIDVASALGWPAQPPSGPVVTLLVESETGGLSALVVDAIQGQRQVVIKSLEQNYDQVPGVAAATILGDGRVALILDVDAVIAARRRAAAPRLPPLAQAS